jgi:hypothetical protein
VFKSSNTINRTFGFFSASSDVVDRATNAAMTTDRCNIDFMDNKVSGAKGESAQVSELWRIKA